MPVIKYRLTLLLFLLPVLNASAQKITGFVMHKTEPLASATITLLHLEDSTVTKTAITKSNGGFVFTINHPGNYRLKASHTGYLQHYSATITIKENNTDDISINLELQKAPADLKNVTVTSARKIIEVKADKTVMNVEGTINATGSTALELLKKSPGITVDNDDNILMNGRSAVQVFIDGKISQLSGADLGSYLRSLQSAQIDAIELISNPSARYDAAGNGGIINIKLKKDKNVGTNASVNAGYAIGTYAKYMTGMSINNRTKKTNIFGNYNLRKAINFVDFYSNRKTGDTAFNLHSQRKTPEMTHGFNTGLDYYLSRKSILGILVNGTISNISPQFYSVTPIIYIPTSTVNRILVSDNETKRQLANINFNTNYHFTNGNGKDLNIDADYGMFRNRNRQWQPNAYYNPDGTVLLNRADYEFISPSDIDIYSLKADYEQDWKKGKLGFGGKTSVVKSENLFERYHVLGPNSTLDAGRSNQFNYSEKINAVYASYNHNYTGLQMQLGLRLENTVSEGQTYALLQNGKVSDTPIQTFNRQYTNLFPNIALTFTRNKRMLWGIAYNRRIDRPRYDYLNPFEYKLDEYSYRKGNPNLVPQYSNTVTLTNVYQNKLTSKLSYGYIKDLLAQVVDTTEVSKSFITHRNLATQKIASLNISYPVATKGYTGFFSFNGFYSRYEADFGGVNRTINLDVLACNINMQHSLKWKYGLTADLLSNYNSPTIWQGSMKTGHSWNIDAGIQKSLFKGAGNVRAVVTDIFNTQNTPVSGTFAGQITNTRYFIETRQFKLNFTYRFGNIQLKGSRIRNSGAEDELKRTRGGS